MDLSLTKCATYRLYYKLKAYQSLNSFETQLKNKALKCHYLLVGVFLYFFISFSWNQIQIDFDHSLILFIAENLSDLI